MLANILQCSIITSQSITTAINEDLKVKVKIKETNQVEELSIIDAETGCDYVGDFIGNHDALNTQFIYDDENDVWVCDQETFEWWSQVINENQKLNYRIEEMKEKYGSDKIHNVLQDVCCDLENHASQANGFLDDFEKTQLSNDCN